MPSTNITKSPKIGMPPGIVALPYNWIMSSAPLTSPCQATLNMPSSASATHIPLALNMPHMPGSAPPEAPKSNTPLNLTTQLHLMLLTANAYRRSLVSSYTMPVLWTPQCWLPLALWPPSKLTAPKQLCRPSPTYSTIVPNTQMPHGPLDTQWCLLPHCPQGPLPCCWLLLPELTTNCTSHFH